MDTDGDIPMLLSMTQRWLPATGETVAASEMVTLAWRQRHGSTWEERDVQEDAGTPGHFRVCGVRA